LQYCRLKVLTNLLQKPYLEDALNASALLTDGLATVPLTMSSPVWITQTMESYGNLTETECVAWACIKGRDFAVFYNQTCYQGKYDNLPFSVSYSSRKGSMTMTMSSNQYYTHLKA
jgi:hypothetical protein